MYSCHGISRLRQEAKGQRCIAEKLQAILRRQTPDAEKRKQANVIIDTVSHASTTPKRHVSCIADPTVLS